MQPPVEPRCPAGPPQDAAATQEPVTASDSHLGPAWGSGSSLTSSKKGSNTSHLSSGYAGDEESSEVSLVVRGRVVRLNKRLSPPAGGTHTRAPKSRPAGPADPAPQPGGEA